MTIQLGPGGNTVLDHGLEYVQAVLIWQNKPDAAPLEIDACAFLVTAGDKVRTDRDFIFYNQPDSPCGAIRLRSGTDERQIFDIDLAKVPEEVAKIEFGLAIHPQPGRVLNFSQLREAGIEIANGNSVLIGYILNPKAHPESALLFGELYRHRGKWKFRALGQGFMGGLAAMAHIYGVKIAAEPATVPKQPEMILVPKAPVSPPPLPSLRPRAPSSSQTSREIDARSADSSPKKKRSKRVPLVLAGAAAVFMLTRCDSDDRVRYVYANQADCIEDWDVDDCYYDDGHYYSYVSTSHPKFKSSSKVGSKALKVVRSGFGKIASRFGSSRS